MDSPQTIFIGANSGPSIEIRRDQKNRLSGKFLPWHQGWSHGVPLWLLLSLMISIISPISAICMSVAAISHILLDQGGALGTALFSPLSSRRIPGWRIWSPSSGRDNATVLIIAATALLLRLAGDVEAELDPLRIMFIAGIIIILIRRSASAESGGKN